MSCLRVRFDGALPGAANMATDQRLLQEHRPGDDPVLRLYRWRPAAVSIGYNQDLDAFAQEALDAAGIDLVRRPTGGRAILHADELTYAVVGTSPGLLFGDSLHQSYQRINAALVSFLSELGIAADLSSGESRSAARALVCFRSAGRHEIRVGGRKLVGSAQRRTRGVFLQHGSILTGPGHLDLLKYLQPERAGGELDQEGLAALTTDLGALLGRRIAEDDLDRFAESLAAACGRVLDLPLARGSW